MALNRNSFRINAATAARSAAMAAIILGGTAFTTRAETVVAAATPQSSKVTPSADCKNYITSKEILGDVKCEIIKGKMLDQDIKAEACIKACLIQLTQFKKDKPDVFATFGEITRKNACELAARLPQKSAALN